MIAARQIAFGGSKRKPYDAEIEYLESTGTQYMLFDETINGIDIETLPSINNSYGVVGKWNNGSRADTIGYTTVQNRGLYVRNASNSNQVYLFDLEKKIRHITVRGVAVTIDEESFEMGVGWGSYLKGMPFALFGCYNSSTTVVDALSCQIGRCKLYRDDVLVRDLIPVRVGADGYMYDRVSGQLFGNAGTGEFVLGSDAVSVNGGGGGITADV